MYPALRVWQTLVLLSSLTLAALTGSAFARADEKPDKDKDKSPDTSKKVKFNSYDGVELCGTFYPKLAGGKDKDTCVILLHNFDRTKGGNSHQDGWDHLAEELQKEGYTVLSFDFRGFGESKQVAKEQFWDRVKARQNQFIHGANRAPDSIDFKEFPPSYYPNLVNDIAAARSYLDRKNEAREVNSSNLIVIGAGEGATLGALWLASECRRKRARGYLPDGRPDLDDPESRDVACAIWLSISPTLAGLQMQGLRGWLMEAGAEQRIPMGFLYGVDDKESKEWAARYVSAIHTARSARKADLKFTVDQGIKNTKLRGSQLLTKSLQTEDMIKNYLESVVEKRGVKEARTRDPMKTYYVWSFRAGMPMIAKTDKEELLRALPLPQLNVPLP